MQGVRCQERGSLSSTAPSNLALPQTCITLFSTSRSCNLPSWGGSVGTIFYYLRMSFGHLNPLPSIRMFLLLLLTFQCRIQTGAPGRCTAGQFLYLPCGEVLPYLCLISGLSCELFCQESVGAPVILPTDIMYSSCSINWPCLGQPRDVISFQVDDSGHSFPGGSRAATWLDWPFHRVSWNVLGSGVLEALLLVGVTMVPATTTLRRMRPAL